MNKKRIIICDGSLIKLIRNSDGEMDFRMSGQDDVILLSEDHAYVQGGSVMISNKGENVGTIFSGTVKACQKLAKAINQFIVSD